MVDLLYVASFVQIGCQIGQDRPYIGQIGVGCWNGQRRIRGTLKLSPFDSAWLICYMQQVLGRLLVKMFKITHTSAKSEWDAETGSTANSVWPETIAIRFSMVDLLYMASFGQITCQKCQDRPNIGQIGVGCWNGVTANSGCSETITIRFGMVDLV